MEDIKKEAVKFYEGVKRLPDYVKKTPCAREGLLAGIGGGTVIGVSRFLVKGNVLSACNFAVISFALLSTGSWEYCRYRMEKGREEALLLAHKMREYEMHTKAKGLAKLYESTQEKTQQQQKTEQKQ
eukprot:comp11940_c0_seq1/m.6612 comp11940_c0_seq1/g.6612  ORF comp11940_c0_seq1/g.6612 comp11940_c0_seq1/m.6612 type:complete len:127 (-) comp11940_c0_seq1:31-411(-)